MSNRILTKDYLLYGRAGMGKLSITKLISYLHGFNFKEV
jgi:hypothetical protein